jgi:hypothetical protein
VGHFVSCRRDRTPHQVVAEVEELGCFDQHLGHVLVALCLRTLAGIPIEEEDVHLILPT